MAGKAKDGNVPQAERFKQAARELGCDDDPERFKEIVGKIAKAPPAHKEPSKGKREKSK